jgi:MraZ protein
MFLGEFHHNLDNKNRIAIPSKFREGLKDTVIITRGLDGSLALYPQSAWQVILEKLSNLSIVKSNSRAFSRFMLSGAMDVVLDKQGRIVIPEYLKKYANINKKAVLVGLFDKVEIWSEDRWDKYRINTEKNSNEIAEKLGDIETI